MQLVLFINRSFNLFIPLANVTKSHYGNFWNHQKNHAMENHTMEIHVSEGIAVYYKIWQILKHFSGTFHQALTSFFLKSAHLL